MSILYAKGQQRSQRQKEYCLSAGTSSLQPSDRQRASSAKLTDNLPHIRALGDSQPSMELAPLFEYKTAFCTVIGRRRACVRLERCGAGGDKGHSGWTWKTISTGCKGDCAVDRLTSRNWARASTKWRSPVAPKGPAREGKVERRTQRVTCTVPLPCCCWRGLVGGGGIELSVSVDRN